MNYLTETLEKLKTTFPGTKAIRPFADNYGIFTHLVLHEGREKLFVAKNSTKEHPNPESAFDLTTDTVSVHRNLVYYAKEFGYTIIMCLAGRFFEMDPITIIRSNPELNEHNHEKMMNFTLTGVEAKELFAPGDKKPEAKQEDLTL